MARHLLVVAFVAASPLPGAGSALAAAEHGVCPSGSDPGWTLSTTTFDRTFSRHPFVGNGYLGQRVPPAGMGYVVTGEKTGWPLYTPRYDGAFVAGLYGKDPQLAGNREVIAAIPTWTTLTLSVGDETYGPETPADRITDFEQTLLLRCGLLRTSLTWTTAAGAGPPSSSTRSSPTASTSTRPRSGSA